MITQVDVAAACEEARGEWEVGLFDGENQRRAAETGVT